MENDLISMSKVMETIRTMSVTFGGKDSFPTEVKGAVLYMLSLIPTVEAEPVRHGRWVHEIHDFYRDSMCEDYCLSVFITAKCSECGEKHRETGQEYSQDFIGEEDGERPVENVAEKIDLARRNYLAGLRRGRYRLKNYCPNCGAKMDAKEDGHD